MPAIGGEPVALAAGPGDRRAQKRPVAPARLSARQQGASRAQIAIQKLRCARAAARPLRIRRPRRTASAPIGGIADELPGLIAALATVAAILSGPAGPGPASARSGQEPDLAAYDLGIAAAVRSDLTASVRLPDGGQVYVFGDTVAVNGQVICGPSRCPDGYPHDSIAIQPPGTATFPMQSCAAAACPYGWQ